MPPIVNLENVGVTRGVTTLFTGVSLGVQDGDRIGVLGLNGSGKSTLMAVLGGRLEPNAGRIAVTRGVRIEMVDQSTDLDPAATVRDVALHTFSGGADHHWASDSAVRGVLTGLGLGNIGLDTPLGGLSGGEQRRVMLAAALVTDADLLILDEPTNHLDIEGISWLAEHLLARRGALIAVTHDRWFLDAVATTTWEVVDQRVEIREGGYSDWVFARAERLRLAQAAEERRQNLARKELAWLRRGPPARTSKPRYRIEAAEALIADVPEPRNSTELHSFARRRLGKDVFDVEDLTVALPASGDRTGDDASGADASGADAPGDDAGRVLLDDLTWRIGPGDRVGVVGVNGSGKSTLLRVLTDDPDDTSSRTHALVRGGTVKRGRTVEIGYLSQDAAELPAELRLLEAVSEIAGTVNLDGRDMTASQLAERFGFTHAQQWTRVGELSGGQRRRLQLMRILMASPNVLILDEPTNDLDTDTLTSLEDLLDGWPGTMIVVSHDRYLIERVTDDVYALFGDGALTHLPGGVDEYLRRRAQQPVTAAVSAPARRATAPAAPATPAAAAAAPARDAGELRALRKDLQRLEKKLESLQRKQDQLHAQLAEVGADYTRAAELNGQLSAASDEHGETELAWLEIAEQLEG